MLSIYKTNKENVLEKIKEIEQGCWINMTNPTKEELSYVSTNTNTDIGLMEKVLDDNELARIETNDKSTLVIVDFPIIEDHKRKSKYITMPLGIMISSNNDYFITITLKESDIFFCFIDNKIKELNTSKKTRFIIQILLQITIKYLRCLNAINDEMVEKEKILIKSTENKDLISLLNLQKSLVYFITSLKENESILERLSKNTFIPIYDDDLNLLEDAIIENKQGIETATIYREILSSMSETYATIISNNLNVIMKFLAGITIVFSVPTMVSSFLGMNVPLGFLNHTDEAFIIIVVLSLLVALLIALILKKKDML